MAGKGEGRKVLTELVNAMYDLGKSEADSWQTHGPFPLSTDDDTARLVLEPLRWALATRPEMIACEQVQPVLPLWEAMADVLAAHGYWTWAGLETAEQFGVPQTRQRAFLIASRLGQVAGPVRTHQRYVGPRRELDQDSLFEPPARQRIVAPGEEGLLPWVSMAQALGWDEGPSPAPAPTVTSGGADTGGVEVFASKGARARARAAVRTHQSTSTTGERYERSTAAPSPTIVGSTGLWKVTHQRRGGHHTPGAQSENAVRVTVEQAACLQSFPDDHPWGAAGSKSAAFKCIGNAVPPLMAGAVLEAAFASAKAEVAA
jgi:DNA (cytosine-5)-methyltransferase 1